MEVRKSVRLSGFTRAVVRRLHLLLQDFGEELAGSETCFPEKLPESPEDLHTLRTTARVNPESRTGFLFINNHQRKRRMEERKDAAVKLVFPESELVIDHLFLKPGSCAVIPFSLPVGEAFLEKTNASLLPSGQQVLFLWK